MSDSTEIVCVKCGRGTLFCIWMSKPFCIPSGSGDFGVEWVLDQWIEVATQTCICSFSNEERQAIDAVAMKQIADAYQSRTMEIGQFDSEM